MDVLQKQSIDVVIKPFSVREIMKEMENIPFPPSKVEKVNYMWRDIERRALKYALSVPKTPAPYPLKEFDRANLVGVLAANEGWYLEYLKTTYRLWFVDRLEAGSEENLRKTSSILKKDFNDLMLRSKSEEIYRHYKENTKEARANGIFGAPSFQVLDEIFWGDDRLEDAVEFLNSIN
tara:strand:+ start:1083 stop:1616 length:534 start_codon:yes stop_codon:yes gene_type:complete